MICRITGAVVAVWLAAGCALGDVPQLLNYQGELTDKTGKPVDAVKAMAFRFYDAEAGGNLLGGFAETQNVAVTKGVLNVLIGSATTGGVPNSIFTGGTSVYLEISVAGELLVPRQRIVAVGYAVKAANADHAGSATFATSAGTASQASNADTVDGVHAAALEESGEITAAVGAHAASADHDWRYFTEAEADGRFVNVGEANSVSSAMVVDGTIAGADINATYKPAQAANADYAVQAGNADSVDGVHAAELEESAEITSAVTAHAASGAHDSRYFTESESDARYALRSEPLALPLDGTASSTQPAFSITNNDRGMAIRGIGNSTGVGINYGGYFEAYRDEARAVAGAVSGNKARGVHGFATGSSATGVHGESSGASGYGVYGKGATGVVGESATGWGVRGTTTSTNAWAPAVYGECQGAGDGTYGLSLNRHGAVGVSQSADANAAGVWALNTGAGPGILAEAGSGGWAAILKGNLQIRSKGTGLSVVELGEGLDYAEGFNVSDAERITPGTVVVIDPASPGELAASTQAYDRKVAGIVAGANGLGSGVKLGSGKFDRDVALAGRVYCNVDATEAAV